MKGLPRHLPPGREVKPEPKALKAIQKTLKKHRIPYVLGKTWTTDGLFRETSGKVVLRRKEGCLSVEMECAAFFAVGNYRKVQCGQILYSGDDLSGEEYNHRFWMRQTSICERSFGLQLRFVLACKASELIQQGAHLESIEREVSIQPKVKA